MSRISNRVNPASRSSALAPDGPMHVPGPSLSQGLRHAVKDAETVIHGPDRIAIVFESISGFRLNNQQDSIRLQQSAYFLKRLNRCREVMNTVTCSDQVELLFGTEFAGTSR